MDTNDWTSRLSKLIDDTFDDITPEEKVSMTNRIKYHMLGSLSPNEREMLYSLFDFKFNIGDRVKIKNTEHIGKIVYIVDPRNKHMFFYVIELPSGTKLGVMEAMLEFIN